MRVLRVLAPRAAGWGEVRGRGTAEAGCSRRARDGGRARLPPAGAIRERVNGQGLQLAVLELDPLQAAGVVEERAGPSPQPVAAQRLAAQRVEAAQQGAGERGQAVGVQRELPRRRQPPEGVLRQRAEARAHRHPEGAQAAQGAQGGGGQGAQPRAVQPQLPQAGQLPEEHLRHLCQRFSNRVRKGKSPE